MTVLPVIESPQASAPAPGACNHRAEDLAAQTRVDFPLLAQTACLGQPLIYLDHAATSQKPRQVLDALRHYYDHDNANVHRGAHQLSARATEGFETAREKTARFVGSANPREIVFTRNASEAINLVARSWGEAFLRPGDEVLLTVMEHHSNLVPWQLLAARTGCVLRHAGLTDSGELDLDDLRAKLNERTKLVSLVQVSNTLGCLNPIAQVTQLAHGVGALVLVDGCQSLPHLPVDVTQLDCDFLVGSSHKLCGPTGMGFLWARDALLEAMPPARLMAIEFTTPIGAAVLAVRCLAERMSGREWFGALLRRVGVTVIVRCATGELGPRPGADSLAATVQGGLRLGERGDLLRQLITSQSRCGAGGTGSAATVETIRSRAGSPAHTVPSAACNTTPRSRCTSRLRRPPGSRGIR